MNFVFFKSHFREEGVLGKREWWSESAKKKSIERSEKEKQQKRCLVVIFGMHPNTPHGAL